MHTLPAALLLLGMTRTAFWLDVPFVRQEKQGCGAASISMVMKYWAGRGAHVQASDADAARIQGSLYSRGAQGIFARDVTRYFEEKGFRTFVFRGEWRDLPLHLEKGRPLIVCLGKLGSTLHYVVVAGVDSRRGLVFLDDPARGKLVPLDRARFEKRWMDRWTLLAVPAS